MDDTGTVVRTVRTVAVVRSSQTKPVAAWSLQGPSIPDLSAAPAEVEIEFVVGMRMSRQGRVHHTSLAPLCPAGMGSKTRRSSERKNIAP